MRLGPRRREFGVDQFMYKIIRLHDKNLRVELTRAAQRELDKLARPLMAEIHLIFGCMVVKRVWFKTITHPEAIPISGQLLVRFCTVRYAKHCRISHIDSGAEQPSDFPIVPDKKVFVPHWLKVDYKRDAWLGTYGYDRDIARDIANSFL